MVCFDYGLKYRFTQPVGELYIGCIGKISFHNMGHDICCSASRLIGRKGEGKFGIHESKHRPVKWGTASPF